MLDIEEFRRIRERVFKENKKFSNLAELRDYIQDLEIVTINERSETVTKLVKEVLIKNEEKADDILIFKLYWILFHQSFYFVKNLKQTGQLVLKMQEIVDTKNVRIRTSQKS